MQHLNKTLEKILSSGLNQKEIFDDNDQILNYEW